MNTPEHYPEWYENQCDACGEIYPDNPVIQAHENRPAVGHNGMLDVESGGCRGSRNPRMVYDGDASGNLVGGSLTV
jgi:hypothetical protein